MVFVILIERSKAIDSGLEITNCWGLRDLRCQIVSCCYCSWGKAVLIKISIYVSPLERWGHVGTSLSAQFVRSVCVSGFSPSACPSLSCRRSNTRRWPNAGLMLAHCLRHWPSISPVLGNRVVFGATLNVGYSDNAVSRLAHRLRLWSKIETELAEWPVFSYQPLSCWRGDISSFVYRPF